MFSVVPPKPVADVKINESPAAGGAVPPAPAVQLATLVQLASEVPVQVSGPAAKAAGATSRANSARANMPDRLMAFGVFRSAIWSAVTGDL